jgi:tRNA threonylcarbamoyladenosine biosynthesis protein TsaB
MAILCIDTATEDGMVVVARDDGSTAAVRWRSSGRHAENLFSYIESALDEAGSSREELSLVGVDIGPGRFTSVRVGLATAKGLALGLGLPIVGVSSLRVLARSIKGDPSVVRVPVMDAYRGDVFSAAYEIRDRVIEELVAPRFGSPDEVFGSIREAVGARPVAIRGEGVSPDALLAEVRYVMDTEGPADLVLLEPRYLRPSDAKLPDQPLRTDHSG